MNQTNPKSDDFTTLQAHATLRLRIVERLLKRLDNEAIPGKEARRIGCTILRTPYFRLPKPPGPRSKPKPTPPPSFIAFAKEFNKTLAAAKLFVQELFLNLLEDPNIPDQEADRLSLAILRTPLPPATPTIPTAASADPDTADPTNLDDLAELGDLANRNPNPTTKHLFTYTPAHTFQSPYPTLRRRKAS